MYPLTIDKDFATLHKSDVITLDKTHCTILPADDYADPNFEEKWRMWLSELDKLYPDFFMTEDYIQANTPNKKIKDMTSIYSTSFFLKQNNFIFDSEDYTKDNTEYYFVYTKNNMQKLHLSSEFMQALSFSSTVTVIFTSHVTDEICVKKNDAEMYCVIKTKLSDYNSNKFLN